MKPCRQNTRKNDDRTQATAKFRRTKASTPVRHQVVLSKRKTLKLLAEIAKNKYDAVIPLKLKSFSEKFQILLPQILDDETSTHANDQLVALKSESQMENVMIMDLWRSTVNIRRKEIRSKTTQEIIDQYPEYSIPTLVC